MNTSGSDDGREYQRSLVAAIDAEIGVRRWSRGHLADLAGINRQTMDRIFLLRRDMNVAQLSAIADALGIDPGVIALRAKEWRQRLADVNEIIDSATELTEKQKQAIRDQIDPDNDVTRPAVTRTDGDRRANGA
jgi:transcriptional regulator with XRE-family HTH domain